MGTVHALPAGKFERRRRIKLTETVIAKLAPGERIYDDSSVPGFFAVGTKAGFVSFRVIADLPAASRRWGLPKKSMERVVGRWSPKRLPGEITPKAARTRASEMVAKIKRGEDPVPRHTTAPVTGWTILQAWHQYRDSWLAKENASPATVRTYEMNFKRLPPKWHSRPIREMIEDVAGLQKLHSDIRVAVIQKVKKTRSKPTETTGMNSADATLNFLSILSNYARGKDPSLPAWISRAVDKHGKRSREDKGMGLSDLPEWWSSVKTVRDPIKRELALFMLMSGLKEKDALTASVDHLSETEMNLFVPTPKGHRKNKPGRDRAFTLPITVPMLACIHRARLRWTILKRDPSHYLFPSVQSEAGHFSNSVLEHKGRRFKSGHALRHTFMNVGPEVGILEEIVARLVNHKPTSITGRYVDPKKTPTSLREAMERISTAVMKEINL